MMRLSDPNGKKKCFAESLHLRLALEAIMCNPEEHSSDLKYMASFVLHNTWASCLAAGLWQLVTLGESFNFVSFIFLFRKMEMGMERQDSSVFKSTCCSRSGPGLVSSIHIWAAPMLNNSSQRF